MNSRATWLWFFVAAGLFALIFFYQRHAPKPPAGPARILPQLQPEGVTSVQVRPAGAGQLEIRAERTNHTWQLELAESRVYPAQTVSIENLLAALGQLTPAACITAREIKSRPKADEEYGFAPYPTSLMIQQGARSIHLLFGARTAPGDQVFLQVVGEEGAYVVDADILKLIPRSVSDWRNTSLLNLEGLAFDRVAVTNNGKACVLQRETTNGLWRIAWPPGQTRANNAGIADALQKLQKLRIQQFVCDDTKVDLEALGLAPAGLELVLSQGTNVAAWLQFGNSPTNDATQLYARRVGQNSIFTVSTNLLGPWRSSAYGFRDPHLLTLTGPVGAIEVRGPDSFSLQRQTNGAWLILPQNLPADSELVKELLSDLSGMPIIQFVKDVVNPPDLPGYGLAQPARRYILKAPGSAPGDSSTNLLIAELDFGFGSNRLDRVFARRTDESSVYAVTTNDFARLPSAGWQLRERKLWSFSTNDLTGLVIYQRGKVRHIIRKAPYKWALAPGSLGIIDELALEETARGILETSARAWVACGAANRSRYGFRDDDLQVTLEMKRGAKATIEFGGQAPSGLPYAGVTLDGQFWIFEFPWPAAPGYLALPANL